MKDYIVELNTKKTAIMHELQTQNRKFLAEDLYPSGEYDGNKRGSTTYEEIYTDIAAIQAWFDIEISIAHMNKATYRKIADKLKAIKLNIIKKMMIAIHERGHELYSGSNIDININII